MRRRGAHISWPYDGLSFDKPFALRTGPVAPNWLAVLVATLSVGFVATLATYLVAEWRRDGFERLLSSTGR